MLVAIHINANIKNRQQHNKILTVVLITYLLHQTLLIPIWIISREKYLYIDTAVPLSLMYGPLLLFYFKSLRNIPISKMSIILNLIPVVISWIVYFIFILDEDVRNVTSYHYHTILYGCIGLSLFFYSIYILKSSSKYNDQNFSFFLFYLLLAGFFMMYLSYQLFNRGPNDSGHSHSHTGGALIVTLIMAIGGIMLLDLVFRLFKSQYQSKSSIFDSTFYSVNYSIPPQSAKDVNVDKSTGIEEHNNGETNNTEANIIRDFFDSNNITDSTLNLAKAASILNISQNNLQVLIKNIYDTTFSKLLTIKRVEMAGKIITELDSNELPDSLYTQCGFGSKSTFYRNFREINGCSPLQFKSQFD